MHLLLVDNYDSFTYNLVHLIKKTLFCDITVYRNDEISINELKRKYFDGIIISPGSKTPKESNLSMDVLDYYHDKLPIFGVCLGMQCISSYFGGNIIRAPYPMHGKTSLIRHKKTPIFKSIPSIFRVARYHSLIIDLEIESFSLSQNSLTITSYSLDDNVPMSLEHKKYKIYGVQFHPESFLSKYGQHIIKNFGETINSIS